MNKEVEKTERPPPPPPPPTPHNIRIGINRIEVPRFHKIVGKRRTRKEQVDSRTNSHLAKQ